MIISEETIVKKEFKLILSIILSIIIIAIVLSFIKIEEIVQILVKTKIEYFFAAVLTYILLNLGMSKKIQIILDSMGEKITLVDAIRANFGGMIASDFTPARSGYFLTAFILSREKKIELHKTIVSIFAPQLIEFAIKIICSVAVGIIIINSAKLELGNYPIMLAIGLIISAATIVFFGLLLVKKGLLESFAFAKKIPLASKIYYLFHMMRSNLPSISKRGMEVVGLTAIIWILKGIEWFLLAKALDIVIFDPVLDLGFFIFFHSFLTFTNFIPVPSVAGAGTTEATSALIFVLLGSSAETGISFAILARFLMIKVDLIGLVSIVPLIEKEKIGGILEDIENIEKDIKKEES